MLKDDSEDFRLISKEEFSTPLNELSLSEVKSFNPETPVHEIISYSRETNENVFIVKDSELRGIITEVELLTTIGQNYESAKLLPVSKVMKVDPTTVPSSSTILEAIIEMGKKDLKHLLVVDGDVYNALLLKDLLKFTVNTFSRDLVDYSVKVKWSDNGVYLQERTHFDDSKESTGELSTQVFETALRKVMFNETIFCDIGSSIEEAVEVMNKKSTGSLIVMQYETEMCGIITARDLLKKGYGKVDFKSTNVASLMTEAPHKMLEQDILAVAIKNMAKFNYRNVLICNQIGYPVSMVSIIEILRFICQKL